MTTAETELDYNTNFDWNRIQESGKDVVPLSGLGYTGLVNLDNSCYLASTMQVVFSTHGFCSRYAGALERNPEDYDALYNWALVLKESADNISSESSSPSKDALIEEACKNYEEATRLCPTQKEGISSLSRY